MIDPTQLVMFAALGVAFYFLLFRPQQKRAKEQQAMSNALQAGSRVMTTAGILGTIKHMGERQVILEIAPGVEMTMLKQGVAKILGPEDDEFEYADETDEAPTDEAPADFVVPDYPPTDFDAAPVDEAPEAGGADEPGPAAKN